jgi:hypothetical protein
MKKTKPKGRTTSEAQFVGAVPLTIGKPEVMSAMGHTLVPRLSNSQLFALVDQVLSNLEYNEAAIKPLLQLFGYLSNSSLCPDAQTEAIQITGWIYELTGDFAKRRDAYLDRLFIKS